MTTNNECYAQLNFHVDLEIKVIADDKGIDIVVYSSDSSSNDKVIAQRKVTWEEMWEMKFAMPREPKFKQLELGFNDG